MTTKELHNLFTDLCEDLSQDEINTIEDYAQEKANEFYTMDIKQLAYLF